jgi:hypothetical protein
VCGHGQRLPDWLDYASLRSLLTSPPPFGRRSYRNWVRRRLREALHRPPRRQFPFELPSWADPETEGEYRHWLQERRDAWASDPRPLRGLADLVAADGWVPMNWEGTAPLGVRRSLPFFNREVLELAFRCHPSELLGPEPKQILRAALHDDVPAENLYRPDKAVWVPHLVTSRWAADGALPSSARQIVRPDWLVGTVPELPFNEGLELAHAIKVAEYLERQAP